MGPCLQAGLLWMYLEKTRSGGRPQPHHRCPPGRENLGTDARTGSCAREEDEARDEGEESTSQGTSEISHVSPEAGERLATERGGIRCVHVSICMDMCVYM